MKKIAFIDCYINEPVNHCVNDLIETFDLCATYHMPSQHGISSLEALKDTNTFIILGSASHVHESLQWHKELLDFIVPKIKSGSAVLGICFGHQLIVNHFGGEVSYIESSKKNYDVTRVVTFDQDMLGYSKNNQLTLAYSHAQVVTKITDDFEVIASSVDSEFEILKLKGSNYYSLQAHPEASLDFIKKAKAQDALKVKEHGQNFIHSFLTQAN